MCDAADLKAIHLLEVAIACAGLSGQMATRKLLWLQPMARAFFFTNVKLAYMAGRQPASKAWNCAAMTEIAGMDVVPDDDALGAGCNAQGLRKTQPVTNYT